MSADNTIALKVQQLGAEGVRTRLREINDELRAGKPVTKDLKTEIKELSVQVNTQERVTRLSSRAWIEQHRTLQTTQRVMSAVGSVARSVLSSISSIGIAVLAFGTKGSDLVEAEAQLARAHRDMIAALESGDPEKIAEAQDNINIFTTKVKELKDQELGDMASNLLSVAASVALIGSSSASAVKNLGPLVSTVIPTILPVLIGLGTATWVALAPILLIAGIIGLVALAFYALLTPGDLVADFFDTFFPGAGETVREWGRVIDDVFTQHIPNAFIFMANSALGIFDSIVMGAEGMVNGVIAGINAIISAVNAVASFLRLPTIALLPTVSFAGITGNRIDYRSSRNAGGGSSRGAGAGDSPAFARVTRANGGGGGAPAPTINITVNGDVSGEELVDKTLKSFKDKLRDAGFTGFQ